MRSLEQVREAQARYPEMNIQIERDVRWFAVIGGVRHYLYNDWTTEIVDRKLWENDK